LGLTWELLQLLKKGLQLSTLTLIGGLIDYQARTDIGNGFDLNQAIGF
jgi:hypothetical protein